MKNSSPAQSVRDALAKLAAVESDLQNTRVNLETSTAERAARMKECDLNNARQLDDISRLHVKIDLFPLRIGALEEAQTLAEMELLTAENHCISKEVNPRAGQAHRAAEAKVRGQLKSHFADSSALDRAVRESQLVQEAEALTYRCSLSDNPLGGPVRFAERILDTLSAVEKLEASLK